VGCVTDEKPGRTYPAASSDDQRMRRDASQATSTKSTSAACINELAARAVTHTYIHDIWYVHCSLYRVSVDVVNAPLPSMRPATSGHVSREQSDYLVSFFRRPSLLIENARRHVFNITLTRRMSQIPSYNSDRARLYQATSHVI
jgi:hypothetical protein